MHFLADADVVSHLRVCQMNNNDMPQHSCIVAVATPTMAEHALMLQSNAPDASALIPDICVQYARYRTYGIIISQHTREHDMMLEAFDQSSPNAPISK